MKFGERLRNLRNGASLTQRELARKMNVSVVTISCWESGAKYPSMSAIVALSKILNVTSDFLLGIDDADPDDVRLLNPKERDLVLNYKRLDFYGKKTVDAVFETELMRVDVYSPEATGFEIKKSSVPVAKKYIPKFVLPAAAGTAAPLDTDDFTAIPVIGDVPANSDFAVDIQGNSMEPWILDGQTVYVKRTSEIRNGEVGIFNVDGLMYCKQYYLNTDGSVSLLSSNPELRYSNIHASEDRGIEIKLCGKVIMRPIPLPDYFIKKRR